MTIKQFEWLKANLNNIRIHEIYYRKAGESEDFWMLWPKNADNCKSEVKIENDYVNVFGNHCLGDDDAHYTIPRKYIMQIKYKVIKK